MYEEDSYLRKGQPQLVDGVHGGLAVQIREHDSYMRTPAVRAFGGGVGQEGHRQIRSDTDERHGWMLGGTVCEQAGLDLVQLAAVVPEQAVRDDKRVEEQAALDGGVDGFLKVTRVKRS